MTPDYWNCTITVYHRGTVCKDGKDHTVYQRETAEHCFFQIKNTTSKSGNDNRGGQTATVRIPPVLKYPLAVGDLVANGVVFDTVSDYGDGVSSKEFLLCHPGKSMQVCTVHDNTAFPFLPHYYGSDADG